MTILQKLNADLGAVSWSGSPLKKITVIYFFNHSRMGFSNEITVDAFTDEHAVLLTKKELCGVYGSNMLPRFSFKIKSSLS